jgi:hypothetical protein
VEKKLKTNMANIFHTGLTKEEMVVLLINREKELIKDLHIKNQREIKNKLANKSKLRIKIENNIMRYPRLTLFLIKFNKTENIKSRLLSRFRRVVRFLNSRLK